MAPQLQISSTLTPETMDDMFGFLYLGGIVSTALWGVGLTQLFFYYWRNSKLDARWLKSFALGTCLIDTIHQVVLLRSLYSSFEKDFENNLRLIYPDGMANTIIIAATVGFLVKSFFVSQFWHLNNKGYFSAGMLFAIFLAQFTAAVVYFGRIAHFSELVQVSTVVSTIRVINTFNAVADTLNAVTLILFIQYKETHSWDVASVIKRIITYAVSIALVSGTWGLMRFVSSFVVSDSFMCLLVSLVIPKVYLNCLLAFLNTSFDHRGVLADILGREAVGDDDVTAKAIEINIDVETVHMSENEKEL